MTNTNPNQIVALAAMAVILLGATSAMAAPAVHHSQRHLMPPPINPIHLNGLRAQPTRQ